MLETGYYRFTGMGEKRIRRAYLTYDMRLSSGSVTLRTSAITTPEDTYDALSPNLAMTTHMERKPVEGAQETQGHRLL